MTQPPARLYLISGPFDPETDLKPGTRAVAVDENVVMAFRSFCKAVQIGRSIPDYPLDFERMLARGGG